MHGMNAPIAGPWWVGAPGPSKDARSVFDRLLRFLAERLGASPAAAGEEVQPQLRFEQPLPQWLTLVLLIGSAALIFGLYQRERRIGASSKLLLASLRFALVLIGLFMISEAVIDIERTGRPYFVVLADDSASMQVIDRYADAELNAQARELVDEAMVLRAVSEAQSIVDTEGPGVDPDSEEPSESGDRSADDPTDPASSSDPSVSNVDGSESSEVDQDGSGDSIPAIPDADLAPERIRVVRGILARGELALLKQIKNDHRIRLYRVSDQVVSSAESSPDQTLDTIAVTIDQLEANGATSRLGDGILQVLSELRGVPPAGILLLSDGRVTEGAGLVDAAEAASRKGVPIWAVGVGDVEPPRDLELADLEVDEVVFVDDDVPFRARLTSRGFEGTPLTITLKRQVLDAEDPDQVEVLETLELEAPPDGVAEPIELNHRPDQVGQVTYIVEVDSQPRELRAGNNRIVRTVDVRREQIKALLVDNLPRYEYRYAKTYLERDSTVELSVVLQSSDLEYASQDVSALPTLPADRETLFDFDVIVLGDVDLSNFSPSQITALRAFVVDEGGGMMFVAGPYFNPVRYIDTPLEDLLPVQIDDARDPTAFGEAISAYRPRLTEAGRTDPILRLGDDPDQNETIWNGLPNLFWFLEVPRISPTARVLAEHPSRLGSDGPIPLIATQFVGQGRTLWLGTDDLWRWRFRTGDRYFGRVYIQAIRFLARSKLLGDLGVELSSDRRRYETDQPVQIRARFTSPGSAPRRTSIQAILKPAEGIARRIDLNVRADDPLSFTVSLPPLRSGDYTVELLPLPTLEESDRVPISFSVLPPAGEFEQIAMNRAGLVRLASATEGGYYDLNDLDQLLEDLPPGRQVPLDIDPPIPLWNTWPVLGVFLIVLVTEWLLRKRNRLI